MSKTTGTTKAGSGGKQQSSDLDAVKAQMQKPDLEAVKAQEQIPDLTKGGIVAGETPIISDEHPFENVLEEIKDTPGYQAISMKRWAIAQAAERAQHTLSHAEGLLHYGKAYHHYFKLVGLGHNLHGLNVIEIGPADFPALMTCENFKGVIIEPMPSEHLKQLCKEKGIGLDARPFEEIPIEIMMSEGSLVEIWLFNVMQHVIDPVAFIEKAKKVADRIRYFEPIDQPITEYHPHAYTLYDYNDWFGRGNNSVNLYAGNSIPGFHTADCAYGCWIKKEE